MFSARHTLVLAALVAMAMPAGAQERPGSDADWARYEELVGAVRRSSQMDALRRAELTESRRADLPAIDTVAVGPLRVITWPDRTRDVVELVRAGWERAVGSGGGPVLERALAGSVLVLHLDQPIRHRVRQRYSVPHALDDPGFARALDQTLDQMLSDRIPSKVSVWLGIPRLFTARDPDLYREMVLSGETAGRDCALGDTARCRTLLALDEMADAERARAWYDAAGVRATVLETARARRLLGHTVVEHCRQGDDEACFDALLFRIEGEPYRLTTPYRAADRRSLISFARERGGDGSLGRLLSDPDASVAEALEATAGTDLGTLLTEWSADLRQGSVAHSAPERRRQRTTALAWVSVFAFLSMTNTRWRLGR